MEGADCIYCTVASLALVSVTTLLTLPFPHFLGKVLALLMNESNKHKCDFHQVVLGDKTTQGTHLSG